MTAGAQALAVLLASLGATAAQAGPPAARAPPTSSILTPLEATALVKVRASLPQRTVPALSEPLVRAARALAVRAARGDPHPISSSALRAALGQAGVVDPAPAAVVLASRPNSLPEALAAAAHFRGATHVGIGVVARDGVAWAVLLASERRAELDPFPRRVSPGDTAVLRGRLLSLSSPKVYIAKPSGAAREVAVREEDGAFFAPIYFDQPGRWRLEVGGDGTRGPTVAAILEVESGEELPGPPPPDEADPSDPAEVDRRIRQAIDAARAEQGLPPLRGSAALDEQARLHSAAMLAAATVAHRLDGEAGLVSRLAAAGVAYRSAGENLARGDGALDAHRAIAESPVHRANLLAPEASLLGLGIARGTLAGGQPVTYLTEILVEPRGSSPGADAPSGVR
jgi:uncharacterized protein YkwD